MKKRMRRVCALLMAASMVLSAAGCGSTGGGQSTQEEGSAQQSADAGESESGNTGSDELVTITLYPEAGNISSGVIGGWKGEYFASLGFQVEVWAYSDEKTNAILASGDLPDIMYVSPDNLDTMIEADMLLNLDDYLDDMPHLQESEALDVALNYVREYKSAGTGSIYGLPLSVGKQASREAVVDSTDRRAVKLKWDVYEQIGAPEINDYWELIDVMEQMVEACPADEDGTPYYGTILNNGSDTEYWACMTLWYLWQGYNEKHLPYMLEMDMVHNTATSILTRDSMYYEGLRWYNEVYRRGLMDPDSINNDRPTQKAKVDAGYAMVPSGYLPGWAPEYYEYYIPGTNVYMSYDNPYGGANLIGINAETENLDACLAFLDMLADPVAKLIMDSGPEGDYWELDDENNAMLTDKAINYLTEVKQGLGDGYFLESGEQLELWNTPFVINTGEELPYTDGQGNNRIISTTQWAEANEISTSDDSFKQWQETTGYDSWKDWLNANDAFYEDGTYTGIDPLCSVPDDTMQLTVDALRDTVVTASWQMVYAESEEEFEAIWDQMVADCEGLGAQEVIDWRLADIENAVAIKESLQ